MFVLFLDTGDEVPQAKLSPSQPTAAELEELEELYLIMSPPG